MVEAALVAQLDDFDTANVAESVRRSLVARIGQERLDLWFGANAIWKYDQSGLTLDLENAFLLDCVKSFCWDELKCAVLETIDEATPIRLIHSVRLSKPKCATKHDSSLGGDANRAGIVAKEQRPFAPLWNGISTENASGSSIGKGPDAAFSNFSQVASNSSTIEATRKEAVTNLDGGEEIPSAFSRTHSSVQGTTALNAHLSSQPDLSDIIAPRQASVPSSTRIPSPNLQIVHPNVVQRIDSNRGMSPERLRVVNDANLWSDFIPGASNRLAFTAAEMILERPGTLSPLLLHGGSGVGKTHLAKAIAEQLRNRHGLRRVLVMTAEQFTIDYSESARGGGFASFRKKYRDVDGFVLDDLAFCLGKHQTLSELRNTIDNLIRNNKQVILVSDRPLNELTGLGSDLHARISGGMTCNMDPLDCETRRELLGRLIKRHSIELPESALDTLAKSCGGDGRALYGVAFRLLAQQRSLKRALTHDESITASLDLIRACQTVVRITDIEKAVCDNFRLDPKCLQEKGKAKTVSAARMLAMFLARKHTQAAYAEIGEYFGHRQHSTVISAHRKVQQWLDTNTPLQRGSASISVRDVIRSLETTLQVG